MADTFNDSVKKVMYTGLGIAAVTVDAAGKAIETLSKKGEEAFQKSKIANEELKRKRAEAQANMKDVADSLEKLGREEMENIRAKLAEMECKMDEAGKDVSLSAEEIVSRLEKMSKEEIESIKAKLEELNRNWTDGNDKGAEG